ncbi:unnamed protein product [Blumeria hordei]|uniref:Uncharacterized protein n=1 Tax=Blumeria hordei TaxID=2867405 RepID=A0A383UZQ7_BLUHO|nr:unnamed protein product [Blumeria hordei]
MQKIFGISLAITGLIHSIKCTDVPYSDLYLPEGTNGFLCQMDIFTIDRVREVAQYALESIYTRTFYQKYPIMFEDTHIFNEKVDILLSFPIMHNRKSFIIGNPGKIRVILNIWGQIIGVLVENYNSLSKETNYEKCNPVRMSVEEDSIQNSYLNELWDIAFPTLGFNCGLNFFPVLTVNSIMIVHQNNHELDRGNRNSAYLRKYTGSDFKGVNLYSYPVRKSGREKAIFGMPGVFRIVFDMNNYEFKGIINVDDSKVKSRTVWDLSSIPPHKIYSPSSVLNLGREPDNYWPKTCRGRKFKSKAVWLYLEFAMKKWPPYMNGSKLNFPILIDEVLQLWPIRARGYYHNDRQRAYAFAIGHDTSLDTYSLYQANVRHGKLGNFGECMDFTQEEIQFVRRAIGLSAQS